MKKLLLIPYTFTLMNWASVTGLYHFVRRKNAGKEVWLKSQEQRAKRAA